MVITRRTRWNLLAGLTGAVAVAAAIAIPGPPAASAATSSAAINNVTSTATPLTVAQAISQ